MNRPRLSHLAVVAAVLSPAMEVAAQVDPVPEIPPAAQASSGFDAEAATRAYLASVPAEARARSDAYFEGGYWLQLWNVLVPTVVLLALLTTGLSARMRDLGERVTPWRPVHVMAYWTQLAVVVSVVSFPFTVYRDFFREHHYGLATQSFMPWLGDQLIGLALIVILGGMFIAVLNGVLRAAPRTWWMWGSAVAVGFLILGGVIAPVYIAPLFNTYTPLEDPEVAGPILSLARANGIPASEVYVMDASRQTTRISANVSGFLGTERITLNDNLLNRTSLPEIEAVMGHEMGHYVLHHAYKGVLFSGVLIVVMFAVLFRAFAWAVKRWGDRWNVRGVDDAAAIPLLGVIFLWFVFVTTPLTNTAIRAQEYEADIFGLNAARQPDGMALVSLKLGEYRKLDPSRWEELLLFDHPSGRTRIYASMRWKAEHLEDFVMGLPRSPAPRAVTVLAPLPGTLRRSPRRDTVLGPSRRRAEEGNGEPEAVSSVAWGVCRVWAGVHSRGRRSALHGV